MSAERPIDGSATTKDMPAVGPRPVSQPAAPRDLSAVAGAAKADRRLYVWWGAALIFLLVLGLVCWSLVLPAVQVHRVMGEHNRLTMLAGKDLFLPPSSPYIERLGGPRQAARKLALYLRLPEWGFRNLTVPFGL